MGNIEAFITSLIEEGNNVVMEVGCDEEVIDKIYSVMDKLRVVWNEGQSIYNYHVHYNEVKYLFMDFKKGQPVLLYDDSYVEFGEYEIYKEYDEVKNMCKVI